MTNATTLPVAITRKVTELVQGGTTGLARHKLMEFAEETWRFAFAAALAVPNFAGGGAEPEKRVRRSPIQPEHGSVRQNTLPNVVERMLSTEARPLISKPILASEIYRRLGKSHEKLTGDRRIARELRRTNSDVLYEMPDGRWWRRDRPLPHGFGDEKIIKKAPRTNSPLSLKRQKTSPGSTRRFLS